MKITRRALLQNAGKAALVAPVVAVPVVASVAQATPHELDEDMIKSIVEEVIREAKAADNWPPKPTPRSRWIEEQLRLYRAGLPFGRLKDYEASVSLLKL